MRIEKIMTKQVATCKSQDSLHAAAHLMWEHDCGCVPVLDEKSKVIGVITDRDICMAAYFHQDTPLQALAVSSAMSKKTLTCNPEDTIDAAERVMQVNKVRRIPVVNPDGRILGILSLADIAREAAREQALGKQEVTETEVVKTLAAVCDPQASKEGRKQLQFVS